MRVLYVMTYSPWSERARWILHHHGFDFEERVHLPLLGELNLRRAARRWGGPVSVPLLVDGARPVMDSLAIAQYVDALGSAEKLLPAELAPAITAWNGELDSIVQGGRVRGIAKILREDDAALAALPHALRGLPFAAASGRLGARYLSTKYPMTAEEADRGTRAALAALRTALGGKEYLLERFSYADVIAATALHFITPVSEQYVPMEPALRRIWTDAELSSEFRDLLEWRDRIYAKHRRIPNT